MATAQPRYGKEQFAQLGDAIYERDVRPLLKPEDEGKFVAVDIETGEFEIDSNELAAINRLRQRKRDAQPWLVRVGSRSAHRFGTNRARQGER